MPGEARACRSTGLALSLTQQGQALRRGKANLRIGQRGLAEQRDLLDESRPPGVSKLWAVDVAPARSASRCWLDRAGPGHHLPRCGRRHHRPGDAIERASTNAVRLLIP